MIAVKKILTLSKWCAVIVFSLFLVANIAFFVTSGKTSILFFSVIITTTFLLAEVVLKIINAPIKTRVNIRVLIASIFLSALIGEVILRFDGQYDSYKERSGHFFYLSPYYLSKDVKASWFYTREPNNIKNIEDKELKYTLTTNSEGLRDVEYAAQKPANTFRIIALGDSFTEGMGVESNSSTWVKVLESNLNQKSKQKQVTVMNAGAAGSDPFFEYVLLKYKLLVYNPDLVIVAINTSDITNVIARGGAERFLPDTTLHIKSGPWFEPLFGSSYIFRYFAMEVFKYDWFFMNAEERKVEMNNALEKIYSCILSFEELSREYGFKLTVVFHPMYHEVLTGNSDFDKLISKTKYETEITVVDLFDYFKNQVRADVDELYWPINRHHNAEGYKVFAKGVEKRILELNYLATAHHIAN